MGSNLTARTQQAAAIQANPQQGAKPTIGSMIQSMRGEIARALPRHLDADRIARIALTAVRKDPKLERCDPASFMGALLTASQLGLEPGGPAGEAYLVPYGRECTLIIGYQGFAKLFWQSPMAKHLDAQAVYDNDEFDYEYGLAPFLRHKPALGNRGNVKCFYAVAALTSGATAFVVLSPEDVKALRGSSGPNGNIKDPMHWMSRKTAVRQLVKLLPKSADLARAIEADEKVRTDLHEDAIDLPMAAPVQQITASEQGPVNASTGELDDAAAADAAWLAEQGATS